MTARIRWLVGGGAVVAAVAIVVAAVIVLGTRPVPEAMTYVPRDSAIVAELRPDLPGDQLSKVGNLLAHFPGFKDQSILAQKIDETLAKLTKSATNGSVDYASQVKPWLAGPLFAGARAGVGGGSAGPLATSPTASGGAAGPGSPSPSSGDYVVVFTTNGSVTCQPITHGSTSSEAYRGIQISDPIRGSDGAACAIDGRQALVGSIAEIKAAIDAHADRQGIDGLADYRTARDRLSGDRLATVYASRAGMAAGFGSPVASGILPGVVPSGLSTLDPAMAQAFGSLPAWLIAGIRAEDNALVADVVTAPFNPANVLPVASTAIGGSPGPAPSLLTAPPAHASQLASLVPGDTALLYELHGGGVAIQNVLTELRSTPGVGGSLDQLDAALGSLGGAQGLLGWVGDAGFVVLPGPQHGFTTGIAGGLVLVAPDATTASAKASQLRSLLALAGLGGGASISDQTIDGTLVTTVDFGDASSLLNSLGATGMSGVSIPPGTRVIMSIAAHGPAVLIGTADFAQDLIQTPAGSTLADQPSYRTAVGLASAVNDGQLYVAADGALGLADQLIPAADKARYESDIKPYLVPLDALLETTTSDGGGLRVRLVLTAK